MILLVITVLLGIFLRVYNFGGKYVFEGELGKELLYLRQYFLMGKLPLIGMTTSHEWLNYGPFYYWIMMPVFSIFKGNPFILFWAALVVATLGMILNYFVLKKIANKNIAIISTLIQAVSPLLIWQTQYARLHVFFFVLSPIFMYLTYLIWKKEKKWVFWLGIVYGLMFSFHFSQIPLIAVSLIVFWLNRNIYKWKDWLILGIGALIPNITYIWSDLLLFVWVPYRTLNVADKNPVGTIQLLTEYFGRNIFWNRSLWIVGLILFTAVFTHYIYTNKRKIKKEFLPFYLITSISIILISNIIHGAPPVHYFLPIYTTIPILYAVYLSKYKWGVLALIAILLINFKGYFNFDKPDIYIPYDKLLVVSESIVAQSKGEPISIKRIGPYDYYPQEYSQNYKYLILWKGGNLVDNSANTYTIIESNGNINVQK